MAIPEELGNAAIKDVIQKYPEIGEILDRHKIGCTKCKVGICLLKDVVKIHYFPEDTERRIFDEIEKALKKKRGR